MACHTPGCLGEHAAGTIHHTVIYQQRTIVLEHVPASICPECGDVVLSDETTIVIEDLLKSNAGSERTILVYEA